MVGIGLTDLPNIGGGPPGPPVTASLQSNLVIGNFLVTLQLFLNPKCSLSFWSKLAFGPWFGHGKWFFSTNLFITKFDCTCKIETLVKNLHKRHKPKANKRQIRKHILLFSQKWKHRMFVENKMHYIGFWVTLCIVSVKYLKLQLGVWHSPWFQNMQIVPEYLAAGSCLNEHKSPLGHVEL